MMREHVHTSGMPKRPDLMGLSDIARLAGVQRSAVANWRDRHDDFPKPVPATGHGPVFKREAVLAWLEANRPTNLRLEQWLWDAACQVRGPLDAPKFKDYILPLIFLKRLSDVFEDEVQRVAEEVGGIETAQKLVDQDHALVRFYIPPESRWVHIANKTTALGELLTDAVRGVSRQNPRLQGVIDIIDFNATQAGQQIVDNDRLAALVKILGQHRLGLRDVPPDLLGHAYEYLLRKFAEGQGQSAGEFYTPPEVARLMARILDPQPGMTIYDPACGSAGLLIKCHLRLLETHGFAVNEHRELPKDVQTLRLFGQELNPSTFALSRMNAFLHDMDADIALGDTMRRPAFVDAHGHLQKFDIVVANPMWNQDFPEDVYRNDALDRFSAGIPPASSADWGWAQHMVTSLKPDGRMAVVLDTGAVSRGSGNQATNRERDIRKYFIDNDLVESVILLPENLFYNTSAPGIVMVINRLKKHPGELLLFNASQLFVKGRPKNELHDEHIIEIADLSITWKSVDQRCAVVTTAEVASNDYNLSPSRYVAGAAETGTLPLDEAVELLREAENQRAEADTALWSALKELART
jgi:type I restriction enzyme M protein